VPSLGLTICTLCWAVQAGEGIHSALPSPRASPRGRPLCARRRPILGLCPTVTSALPAPTRIMPRDMLGRKSKKHSNKLESISISTMSDRQVANGPQRLPVGPDPPLFTIPGLAPRRRRVIGSLTSSDSSLGHSCETCGHACHEEELQTVRSYVCHAAILYPRPTSAPRGRLPQFGLLVRAQHPWHRTGTSHLSSATDSYYHIAWGFGNYPTVPWGNWGPCYIPAGDLFPPLGMYGTAVIFPIACPHSTILRGKPAAPTLMGFVALC
jgi:hypothetical protein